MKGRVTFVCRDCGEVAQVELAQQRRDGLVSCPACGLVSPAASHRAPSLPAATKGPGVAARVRR